jgi:hypothetical protein
MSTLLLTRRLSFVRTVSPSVNVVTILRTLTRRRAVSARAVEAGIRALVPDSPAPTSRRVAHLYALVRSITGPISPVGRFQGSGQTGPWSAWTARAAARRFLETIDAHTRAKTDGVERSTSGRCRLAVLVKSETPTGWGWLGATAPSPVGDPAAGPAVLASPRRAELRWLRRPEMKACAPRARQRPRRSAWRVCHASKTTSVASAVKPAFRREKRQYQDARCIRALTPSPCTAKGRPPHSIRMSVSCADVCLYAVAVPLVKLPMKEPSGVMKS